MNLSEFQKPFLAYLIGLWLADGHIDKVSRAFRLRISLHSEDIETIERCKAAYKIVFPRNKIGIFKKGKWKCVDVTIYSNNIPKWFTYKPKHESFPLPSWQTSVIDRYTKEFITGLFDGDGCSYVHTNTDYEYHLFTNKSTNILELCEQHLSRNQISFTRFKKQSGITNIFIRKKLDREALKILLTNARITIGAVQ